MRRSEEEVLPLYIGSSSVVKGGVFSHLVENGTVQQKYSFVARNKFGTLRDLDIAEAVGNAYGDLQWGQKLDGMIAGKEETESGIYEKFDDENILENKSRRLLARVWQRAMKRELSK
jgi:hypothetical protein